jgi:hypothetical protein
VHRGHLTDTLETHVKDLHDKWKEFARGKHLDVDPKKFQGLLLHQMVYLGVAFVSFDREFLPGFVHFQMSSQVRFYQIRVVF